VSQALQSLKCCLNPKVLIALAAAGVAVVLQQVLAGQNATIAAEIAALDAARSALQPPSRALLQAEQVAALADSPSVR